ncbi:MAG: NAD(+) synthase [Bacteroidales bacterium]|nr:NAD(+) synthase [Bacteroidales bacterium]
MKNYGFIRVAAATPVVKVASPEANAAAIMSIIDDATENGVSLLVFPELAVSGYTCGDLFGSEKLIEASEKAVEEIRDHTRGLDVTVVVGAPVRYHDKLYNCAVIIRGGQVKGIVPKIYLPDYNEFYEARWFSSGSDFLSGNIHNEGRFLDEGPSCVREGFCGEISFAGGRCNISPNLLFTVGDATFAVEICEDLWTPLPPSSFHCVAGAQIIVNLSSSNEVLLKHTYRKSLVCEQSAHTLSGYIYCSSGYGESTQDLVYAGSSLIYENGTLMAEALRFTTGPQMIFADLDVEKLTVLRQKQSSFFYVTPDGTRASTYAQMYSRINLGEAARTDFAGAFHRFIEPHPFVPSGDDADIEGRCREVISIQVLGLVRRLEHVRARSAVIGISGGLDSTLALIVTVMAFDKLHWPREGIIGVTMPGLGTSSRTRTNADALMEVLGITRKEISVVPAVEQHFRDIGHDPSVIDSVYENAQARERTQILMDISNQTGGIVVGTGDLSELALGWCTYNGDHMSMYAVNSSVPKTLVRELCRFCSKEIFAGGLRVDGRTAGEIISDIVDTPISPELTPAGKDGAIAQLTEDLIGPYELHDFFLYHFFRFGCSPSKILFLAEKAFGDRYERKTLLKWLKVFFKRFFAQQFKRSCLPDGPKVGSVALSPRGDWRMPSDALSELWLSELESL